MTAHLYLIRGVPGSGKTTLARVMQKTGMVDAYTEADLFMLDSRGCYRFDPALLKRCHETCQRHALYALESGLRVAVSNTFTRAWEMQPYIDMGFPFTVLRCEGAYKNVHGVPETKVQQMRERFEDWEA